MNGIQLCLSYYDELTARILFQLNPHDKKEAILVCKRWDQIIYKQTLYGHAQDLMNNLPLILIANEHQETANRVYAWTSKWKILCEEGFSTCKTKKASLQFFNSIIKPLSTACGLETLEQMKKDIISNLSLVKYKILIDQIKPKKNDTTQLPVPSQEDSRMIEAGNPKKRTFDQSETNENNSILVVHEEDNTVICSQSSAFSVYIPLATTTEITATEQFISQVISPQDTDTFKLHFQEQINAGKTKKSS